MKLEELTLTVITGYYLEQFVGFFTLIYYHTGWKYGCGPPPKKWSTCKYGELIYNLLPTQVAALRYKGIQP